MANRRSLGAALDLSADQKAFIKGQSTEAGPSAVARSETAQPEEKGEDVEAEVRNEAPSVRPSRRSRNRRPSRQPVLDNHGLLLSVANLLVPLTTRLRPATASALKKAGLVQRLQGKEPGTVQDIAEEAIENWLRDNGYLE